MAAPGFTDRCTSRRRLRVTRLRKPRKWLTLAVAGVASAAALAACGGSSSSSPSSGGASAGHGKKTLVVWQFWSSGAISLTSLQHKLDSEFEAQYPQYKIDDVAIPYSQFGTKLTAALLAGSGPNLVTVFPGVASAPYRTGLVPLQSYVTSADRSQWRLLNEATSPGGNVYAVPWGEYGTFLYYNKKLFAKAGLNPNDPPTTWQQFISDSQKLAAHGITPLSGGFKDGYEWEWWAYPLLDQVMSPSVTKQWLAYNYSMTSSPFTTVWSDIKSLQPFYGKDASSIPLYNDAYDNFDSGKTAMLLDLFIADLTKAQHSLGTSNVGIFPVPRLPGSQYSPFVDAGANAGWGITKWTDDKRGAWDYISFMESKKVEQQLWKGAQIIPNNAQASAPSGVPADREMLKDMANPLNHSVYSGFPVSVLAINERYAGEMITGQASASSVLSQMEQLRQELRPKITGMP